MNNHWKGNKNEILWKANNLQMSAIWKHHNVENVHKKYHNWWDSLLQTYTALLNKMTYFRKNSWISHDLAHVFILVFWSLLQNKQCKTGIHKYNGTVFLYNFLAYKITCVIGYVLIVKKLKIIKSNTVIYSC